MELLKAVAQVFAFVVALLTGLLSDTATTQQLLPPPAVVTQTTPPASMPTSKPPVSATPSGVVPSVKSSAPPVSSKSPATSTSPTAQVACGVDSAKLPVPRGKNPVPVRIRIHTQSVNIDEPLISIPATTGDAFPPFGKVGWYKGARVPGFPGSAHILGHIDTKTAYQPFWALQFVHLCDKVEVWLSNGQKETDVITGIKHEPKDAVKNDDSVWTTDQRHLLQLFTCWPHNFNHATGHYPEQLIIYTEEVSITG